jgi:hypothetical protein
MVQMHFQVTQHNGATKIVMDLAAIPKGTMLMIALVPLAHQRWAQN